MKQVKRSIVYILIGFIQISAYAQSEVFKIMASHGGVQLAHGSAAGAPAGIGKKVHEDDQVLVQAGGYIALVHLVNGKTIELKTPGNYAVKDLIAKVNVKGSSLADKYSKYVMDELTKVESGDVNHVKNMKVTGSVERAVSTSSIPVCLPKQSDFLENATTISWMKHTKAQLYVVELSNMFDEVILSKETSDTFLVLDRNSLKLSKDNFFKFTVKAKNAPELKSSEYGLKYAISDKANPNLSAEYEEIKSNYAETSAINYLVKASFFRSKKMFLDAKASYEEAIKLEPEVLAYKKAYRFFLEENGLTEFWPYSNK
jgi:hypothetical protein